MLMPMRSRHCRIPFNTIFILALIVLRPFWIYAAGMDDLYSPLVGEDRYLYGIKITDFDMTERGTHGSASFSDFNSDPSLVSAYQTLRFSPVSHLELETGYGHYFPRDYTRSTYDGPTPRLDTIQEHTLHFFQDYFFKLRHRKDALETYIQFQEKRQKAKSNACRAYG